MTQMGDMRRHLVQLRRPVGGFRIVEEIDHARLHRIENLGPGDRGRIGPHQFPHVDVKVALDDAHLLALHVARNEDREFAHGVADTVHPIAEHAEAVRDVFLRQFLPDRSHVDPIGVIVIAENERQVEELALRNPTSENRHVDRPPLHRTQPHALGHLLFAAQLGIGKDLYLHLAIGPLLDQLAETNQGDGIRVALVDHGTHLRHQLRRHRLARYHHAQESDKDPGKQCRRKAYHPETTRFHFVILSQKSSPE